MSKLFTATLNNRPCIWRDTVGGPEVARGTSFKHGSIE